MRSDFDEGWTKILIPILMPVSQIYDLVLFWRVKLEFWAGSGQHNHADEVAKVQVSVNISSLVVY